VSVRLPDRGQQATSRRRATCHNARERDTGERRDVGAAPAGSRPSGCSQWPRRVPIGCLGLLGGGHHLPDRGWVPGRGITIKRPEACLRREVASL